MSGQVGRRAKRTITIGGLGLLAAFSAAACGTTQAGAGQSGVDAAEGSGGAGSGLASGSTGGGKVAAPEGSPGGASGNDSRSTSTRSDVPRCRADQLEVDLGRTEPAAGNRYAPVVFTNTSGRTCGLLGHPGVTVLNADREQIGPDAERGPGNPVRLVTLSSGGSASALLHWASPVAGDCYPTSAYLRAFPPGSTEAIVVRAEIRLCGDIFYVRAVTEGADGTAG